MKLLDQLQRPLEDLRISVTDRCNFRCTYCMPLAEYPWIDRAQILSFEEIARVARISASLGVRKLRITGGEPLVRKDLPRLVQQLAVIDGIDDIALTTNAARLAASATELRAAGLSRITVSLDSLDPETFRSITQRGELQPVLDGLFAARDAGFGPIKLNAVIERSVNDHEILDLVEFSREQGFELRLIEFMDVGNANSWSSEKLVSRAEILATVRTRYDLREIPGRGSRPAEEFELVADGTRIGVIASVSAPFCGACSRLRLTADGKIVTCLFSQEGHDLKGLFRGGADDATAAAFIHSVWEQRSDRYSEQRLVALQSADGYRPEQRKKIEMISLGG